MSDAFSSEEDQIYRPVCRGRRPHLRDFDKHECQHKARTILLAASNSWFPLVFSSLSIPTGTDLLGQLIEAHWSILQGAESVQDIAAYRRIRLLEHFIHTTDDELWTRVEQKKAGNNNDETQRPADLKFPEWQVLSNPSIAKSSEDFEVMPVSAPDEYTQVGSGLFENDGSISIVAMEEELQASNMHDYGF